MNNTLKDLPKHRVYLAGIVNGRNDQWEWQGTVVAENTKQALRFLSLFKKETGFKGAARVMAPSSPVFTKRAKGVSNSMNIR
jgi:hypothetical protein